VSLSKQCGELWYLREVGRLSGEKSYSRNRAVINKLFLWGVIEGGPSHSECTFWLRQTLHHNQLCACCGPRPYLSDMIPSDSESDFITTDSRQTEHLLRLVFMSCPTKIAKVITIALSSLLIALCTVSLSAIPNIIQTINDRMSQGLDIQLEILQTLLTVIRTIRKRTCFAPSLLPRATRLLSFEDLCPLGASAIPITQVPPQDVYYRADRERTYEQLPAPPQGVSLLFTYPRLVCSCP
jgi:hypothetical protein